MEPTDGQADSGIGSLGGGDSCGRLTMCFLASKPRFDQVLRCSTATLSPNTIATAT
jgi:hypothetical protein